MRDESKINLTDIGKNIKNMKKVLIYCFGLIIYFAAGMKSQAAENIIANNLVPAVRYANAYEIGEIKFTGNKYYSNDVLFFAIASRETSRSLPHKVLQAYYYESKRNNAAPRVILRELNTAIKSLEGELKYFDENTVLADTLSLWHYYNTNGFHLASISYTFKSDSEHKKNILNFIIDEGPRFLLDTVVYMGLENVAPEIKTKINKIISQRKDNNFNELELIPEINMIHAELLNGGYYFATYEKPVVSMDLKENLDSVTVYFNTGKRIRIGEINFIDSTRGQPLVVNGMKRKQLDFREHDWYSRRKVNSSMDNLLSIGTFETVSIDTCENPKPLEDSTLNFCVLSNYRKHREWSLGLFGNHTQLTNYNAGIEGSINHRNLFGMAQSGTLFASFGFKDIIRLIESIDNLDYEMQVGAKYAQPLLWLVNDSRVGISASAGYSVRTINNFFQINTLSFPIKFPISLSKKSFFNSMSLDFVFEREDPVNFKDAVGNASKKQESTEDSLRIIQAFYLYNNLYQYLKEPGLHIFTSNSIGFSLIGDSKDNPFNPTKGTYTYIGFDGWNVFLSHPSISGIARFFRFQAMHSQFIPITNNLVGALKGRFGFIRLMDEANVYVPIDKQFFAGGSNSVRGWASRTLRYTKITRDSLGSKRAYEYMQNFIGNGGLIEGSVELRYKFSRPSGFSETIANQIANLGIAAFLDFGNAFHWYLGIETIKLKPLDYLTNLAYSVGLGLRYYTPVGPIRIDFATPIRDPLGQAKPFGKVLVHFGIGHAF